MLVTDRGTDYINRDMARFFPLLNNNHSPRTPCSAWTNGLVEVQNHNLGVHLRFFYKILILIGQFKLKCMTMLTKLPLFLNLKVPKMKLFSPHTLVSPDHFLSIYYVTLIGTLLPHTVIHFPLMHITVTKI